MSKQTRLYFSKSKTADDNTKYLDRIQEMIDLLNSTNGSNDKIEFISDYKDLKPLLKLIYDPLKPFHVTSTNVKKFIKNGKNVQPKTYKGILKLLTALSNQKISGHEALSSVAWWIKKYPEHSELIFKLIDKDLKIRMGAKQINKAFPKLIPQFNVALGHPIEKYPKALETGEWFISRKLDGVRCLTIINPDKSVSFFSRQGNEFLTLEKIRKTIIDKVYPVFPNGVVLDGEVCIINKNNEDFKGVMKEIRKKNHTMRNPRYLLFDCLSLTEFWERKSKRTFSERIKDLNKIGSLDLQNIQVIDQVKYTEKVLEEMKKLAGTNNWEGLILRQNARYEGKRTNKILKVKKFETEEYKVVDIEFGPYQAFNPDTKLTETIETMVSVTILHKKFPVSVGSGFSLNERKKFYKNPDKIKGKIISVQYFEETTDSNGNISLRFPTFKGLYGKQRTI
jgi:DNA ligase-1